MNKQILIGISIVGVFIVGVAFFSFTGSNEPELSENTTANEFSETAGDIPNVVAVVNGVEISRENFEAQQAQVAATQGFDPTAIDAETEATLRSQVLDSLIAQELLSQTVASANIEVPESQVETQLQTVASQFGSTDEFDAALEAEGLTEASLREQVASEIAIQIYLEEELSLSSITASEEEITTAYEEIDAAQSDVPALEEARNQVVEFVEQQKQQEIIAQHVAELRSQAKVEVFL
ncbi:MAG: SurA N-terminal domain-containing protein [Candidatus Paceibacterota bacterium]